MSFSFNVRAATKAEVLIAATNEMRKVVEQQPIHAIDADLHLKAAKQAVDLLVEPSPGESVNLSVNGYIVTDSVSGDAPPSVRQVSQGCFASIVRIEHIPV